MPELASIPWWKNRLVCWVIRRRKWKLAKAYNTVSADMLLTDRHELGEQVRAQGDKLWAEIYNQKR